ncbi:MAG: hypothetical protein ACOH13_15730 [Flavobacteriales bacterium]
MRILFLAIGAVFAATTFAQDSLFYTNGNVIVGQVEEIGLDVIKYRTSSDGNAVLITVEKQDLSQLKLKDGQAYLFSGKSAASPYSPEFLERKNAITFDVIAPALNHATIGYERVMKPRVNLVLRAGYIGLWNIPLDYSDLYNAKGALVSAGVKLMLPRTGKRGVPAGDAHPLAGWYLRPELMYSAWGKKATYFDAFYTGPIGFYPPTVTTTHHYSSAAAVLSIGRTLFLGEHITFDISGGLGYGMQWHEGQVLETGLYQGRESYVYSHTFIGSSTPLVMNGGLRFGYAF